MQERQALEILIQKSGILTDEAKRALQERLEELSDADVRSIGVFLATEKAQSIAEAQKGILGADLILAEIEKIEAAANV